MMRLPSSDWTEQASASTALTALVASHAGLDGDMGAHGGPCHVGQDPCGGLQVRQFTRQCVEMWWACDAAQPPLGPAYTPRQQQTNEQHLQRFLASLTAELRQPPRSAPEREALQGRLLAAFRAFAGPALGFEDRELLALMSSGMAEVAGEFAGAARRFDPTLSAQDIYQASRNVVSMNLLQVLLQEPVRLTPAIFAYSLLYPYSDNCIDDPAIAAEAKLAFSRRFRERLAGGEVAAANRQEQAIFQLVGLIEGQYDRARYPQVFESLLAIHSAQARSLGQQRGNASPYEADVLGISFEKGGTSVLADGYLVAGSLMPGQAELLFTAGAFMQLVDDLEDVQQDLRDGSLTVFTQTARHWPLDAVTSRTLHFGARVLKALDSVEAPALETLKGPIRKSAGPLLVATAGLAGRFYSSAYLQELEAHSPFRLAFLRRQRQRLARQGVSLARLIDLLAPQEPAGLRCAA